MKTCIHWRLKREKKCLLSPWQQSCWSRYGFHAGCNREFFQRAPFIVQITNGTFMPSDKWQLIIYPDSAETTHSSNGCALTHALQRYTSASVKHRQLPHLDEATLSGLTSAADEDTACSGGRARFSELPSTLTPGRADGASALVHWALSLFFTAWSHFTFVSPRICGTNLRGSPSKRDCIDRRACERYTV